MWYRSACSYFCCPWGAKNKEKLTKLVTLLSFAILGYGVLLIGFIQFIAPTVIPILYGANYQESLQPLYILTIGLPFYGLNRLMVQVLNATDCQKWTFYATSTGAVLNIIANIVLIPHYGIIAAAITTIITEAIVWLLALYGFRYAPNNLGSVTRLLDGTSST